MNPSQFEDEFIAAKRPHILNITNHGIHQWEIVPGLIDTGGQNIFVNHLTDELVKRNYKVTILNRGGYKHPETGQLQVGTHYKSPYQRIHYLEDGLHQFVRKEDMGDQISALSDSLKLFLDSSHTPVDILITHYWDGGLLGLKLRDSLHPDVPHVWVPHSLGEIKDKITVPVDRDDLRIEERIKAEREVLQYVDIVGVTSDIIRSSLVNDYQFQGKTVWLPPCVDTGRYHSRNIPADDPLWQFLSQRSGLTKAEIQNRQIISEISRTDQTKRKDVLIKAFAGLQQTHPDTFLILTIDQGQKDIAQDLSRLIHTHNLETSIAVVGSVREELPAIYAISDIYCTPSVMEGFGMSAQEAASTKIPVISSDRVVFVTGYLLGDSQMNVEYGKDRFFILGQGAIVVPADDVDGFKCALAYLLDHDDLRKRMGEAAYHYTIPYFTWETIGDEFIASLED